MENFTHRLGDTRNTFEKLLFSYIKSKNVTQIQTLLEEHGNKIDLSQKDHRGYTFLEEAVLAQNEDLINRMLSVKPHRPIDNALILASQLKNDNITDILLEYLKINKSSAQESSESDVDDDGQKDSSIATPRTLTDTSSRFVIRPKDPEVNLPLHNTIKVFCEACAVNNLKIIQSFLDMNVRRLPTIKESLQSSSGDHLKDITEQLNIWKAITSPVYISLTEKDPVVAAFKINNELKNLSKRYREHRDELQALAMKTEQYAVDLLSLCNTKEDVCHILSLNYNVNMPFAQVKYGRLLKALEHKQKKFISHPNCQTVVNNLWTVKLPHWRNWGTPRKLLYVTINALSTPFVTTATALGVSCLPPGKIPLNRCIYSVTSYLIFLVLLALYLTRDLTPYQLLHLQWCIAGFVISSMLRVLLTDLPMHGLVPFCHTFWSMYELIMHTIFLGAFTCIIWFQINPIQQVLEVGKSMLSIGSILAFGRLFNWFHLHPSLGPFIIAFKKIIFVVCRMLCIFIIIFLAFGFSLHFLYKGKFATDLDEPEDNVFGKLSSTFSALFWAMYGHGESAYSKINIPSSNLTDQSEPTIHLTEVTGTFLWGLFHVACIIVLINMLIAIMTGAFERIYEDCDTEWKFARTKMQMYYLEDCAAIPEPFNVIYFLRLLPIWIFQIGKKPSSRINPNNHVEIQMHSTSTNQEITSQSDGVIINNKNNPAEQEDEYMELIQRLIKEYIRKKSASTAL